MDHLILLRYKLTILMHVSLFQSAVILKTKHFPSSAIHLRIKIISNEVYDDCDCTRDGIISNDAVR
jgi:hypothetical protein